MTRAQYSACDFGAEGIDTRPWQLDWRWCPMQISNDLGGKVMVSDQLVDPIPPEIFEANAEVSRARPE